MRNPILIVAILLFAFTSCSTQEDNETKPEAKAMKVFKSADEFKATFDLFNSFKSNADFENWSSAQNFESLYNSEKFVDEDEIPFKFLFILNNNKEFMIGNNLITFSKGTFYKSPVDKSGNVSSEKKVFATVTVSKIPMKEAINQNQDQSRVNIGANGGDYKEGWEGFNRVSYAVGCNPPTNKTLNYRLVHYLVIENIAAPGLFTQSNLMFKLRMSQYTGGSWVYNNTSTERLYSFNVSGDWAVRNKAGGGIVTNGTGSFYESDSNSCSNPLKGTKSYWLGFHNFVTGTNLSLYVWDVALSGHVFHKVNGDVNEIDTNVNW